MSLITQAMNDISSASLLLVEPAESFSAQTL